MPPVLVLPIALERDTAHLRVCLGLDSGWITSAQAALYARLRIASVMIGFNLDWGWIAFAPAALHVRLH